MCDCCATVAENRARLINIEKLLERMISLLEKDGDDEDKPETTLDGEMCPPKRNEDDTL